jgi:hypothetical protein
VPEQCPRRDLPQRRHHPRLTQPGTYNTRISITYSGEYGVAGNQWIPIPGCATGLATVDIDGPTQTLTVKTAHARLVNE